MIAAHLGAPIPDVSRFCSVPVEVRRLLSRLLAKTPAARPTSAAEVVFEIDRYLDARAPTVTTPRLGLRFALVTAAGIAMTLATIGAWYRWWRGPREQPALDGGAVGTAQVPVFDAMLTVEAPTIEIDAATRPIQIDAAPTKPALPPPRPKPSSAPPEVVPELGSAAAGDVNTTVLP